MSNHPQVFTCVTETSKERKELSIAINDEVAMVGVTVWDIEAKTVGVKQSIRIPRSQIIGIAYEILLGVK